MISGGGIFMIVIGALMLIFPGGCGLMGLATVISDYAAGHRSSGSELDLTSLVIIMSCVGLAVGLLGFLLIRWGMRRRVPFPRQRT